MKARMRLCLMVIILVLPALACGRAGTSLTPTVAPVSPTATAAVGAGSTVAPTDTLPPPTATPTPSADGHVTATLLNVRTGPGLEYDVVGQLTVGTPLTVRGTNADRTWLQIVAGDEAGWVSAEYVALAIPLDSIPVIQSETPTPQPSPTVTPTPTAEPGVKPTATAEELAYMAEVRAIEADYLDTLDAFRDLGIAVQENPLLVFDSAWKAELREQIARVDATHRRVLALTPPPPWETAHAHLVRASEHFQRASELVAEGLDELNPAKLTEAAEELQLGAQEAERARAEYDKLW